MTEQKIKTDASQEARPSVTHTERHDHTEAFIAPKRQELHLLFRWEVQSEAASSEMAAK